MLKAKVANLLFHDQRDRQDVRHASIMITCCRHYLIDTFEAAASGRIGERDAVDRFMSARNVVSSEQAQQADKQFQLDVYPAIPPAEGFSNLARPDPIAGILPSPSASHWASRIDLSRHGGEPLGRNFLRVFPASNWSILTQNWAEFCV
jgi:hypothetical protein